MSNYEDRHVIDVPALRAAAAVAAPVVPVTDAKDSNPKQAIGSDKLPLDLVPETAIALYSLAHLDGALKYGKWNWRASGVRLSTYLGAIKRHIAAFENGEDIAPDGVHHLGHIGACLDIIIDSEACGKLTDDRAPKMNISSWFEKLTPWVKTIKERHKDKNPRHYTIEDKT